MTPEKFRALIDQARRSVARAKQANHEAYGDRPRWRVRPRKPKKAPMTDAERAKNYRDRKRAEKIAAAPVADRAALEADARHRLDLLQLRLASSPLPPKLKHLPGREEELAMAWLAREIVATEPEYRDRPGGPRGISRIIDIFKTYFTVPALAEEAAAMRRRLKIISYLEDEGIWPAVRGTEGAGD